MRHLTAVKPIGKDGWHYASLSKKGGHPIGFCAEHDVHPTEREARECYSEFLKQGIRLDGVTGNWGGCSVCGGATKTYARTEGDGWAMTMLCATHLTQEHAIKALGYDRPAGDRWQS